MSAGRCAVCEKVSREDLLALDTYLADPSQWPAALFAGWDLPRGSLPAQMRTWGAVKLGIEWLRDRNYAVTKVQMQRHYREHVPIVVITPDDVAARAAPTAPGGRTLIPAEPTSYIDVYKKGLSIGGKALDMLMARIEALEEEGSAVSNDLLLEAAKLGVKLATSQAGIMARGLDIERQKHEELEGFRAGSAPEASPRFGDHRIRVIEGEARPIVDRGRTDRHEYNERAREDGSPTLPA